MKIRVTMKKGTHLLVLFQTYQLALSNVFISIKFEKEIC